MLLTKAIELVVTDTRECTDPNATSFEAIQTARTDLTMADVEEACDQDDELIEAYRMVMGASVMDIGAVIQNIQ